MDANARKPLFKIIILGDSGVGKTSLLNQYVNKKFTVSYKRTTGADFLTKDILVDGQVVTLQIWDTVGQERFQSMCIPLYRGADCVILVYDVTSLESYYSLSKWKEEFVIQGAPRSPKNFPFVVLGNKIDLGNPVFSEDTIQDMLNCDYQVPYYETSAKDNTNVDDAFFVAAKMAFEQEKEDLGYCPNPGVRFLQNNRIRNNCYC